MLDKHHHRLELGCNLEHDAGVLDKLGDGRLVSSVWVNRFRSGTYARRVRASDSWMKIPNKHLLLGSSTLFTDKIKSVVRLRLTLKSLY